MSKLSLAENQSKISTLTSYLSTLANTAENHFWNGIRDSFSLFGATGTTDPLTVATDLCASAEEICNQILIHLADMTGETATKVDWSTSVLTQWTTPVGYAVTRIGRIVSDILAITTSAPDGFLGQTDYDVRTPLQAALDTLYDEAEAVLNDGLGPYFPSIRTSYWPKLKDTSLNDAYPVQIKAVEDDDELALYLYDEDENALRWNGNQADWNVLEAGDLVYIETLTVTGLSVTHQGKTYEVDSITDTNPAHITLIAPGVVATSPLTQATSAAATTPGTIFRIRKIKGV
jgi:hypothetical protein